MSRQRGRGETCPYCHKHRAVSVDLDSRMVTRIDVMPDECIRGEWACMEEMRDKCLLSPFEEGKTRLARR